MGRRYTVEVDGRRVTVEADSPEAAMDAAESYVDGMGGAVRGAVTALTQNITSQAQNPGIGQHYRPPPPPRPRQPFAAPQVPQQGLIDMTNPATQYGRAALGAVQWAGDRGADLAEAITGQRPEPLRSGNPVVDALLGGPAGVEAGMTNMGINMVDPSTARGGVQAMVNQVYPWTIGAAANGRFPSGDEASAGIAQAQQERQGSGVQTGAERYGNLTDYATGGYRPSTYAGGMANRGGQMLPYALTPGGVLPTVAGFGLGEAARGAGAIGGANADEQEALGFAGNVLGGAVATPFVGMRPSETIIRNAGENLNPGDTAMARALMENARNLPGGGIRLGGDEALSQTAGARAAPLQARVRQAGRTPRGSQRLATANAERPGEIRATTEAVADRIAPRIEDPARVGTRAQDAADNALLALEAERTAETRPTYRVADKQSVDTERLIAILEGATERANQDRTGLVQGPLRQAIEGVDPAWDAGNMARYARYLRDEADIPFGQPGALNRELSGAQRGFAENILGLLRETTAIGPGDELSAQISRNLVDPMSAGPLGDIRSNNVARNADPQRQASALYPQAPPEGFANNTVSAIQALDQQAPGVSADLARIRLTDALNQGTRRVQGGENLMGGANTANLLVGNQAGRDAFLAGIGEAAPGARPTVETLLDALQATGTRRGEGSPTATDAAGLADMGMMDAPAQAAIGAARPWGIPQRVTQWMSDRYVNSNARAIIDVLESDPATFERTMNDILSGDVVRGRRQTALIKALAAAQAQNQ